jgi:hypothetical protein
MRNVSNVTMDAKKTRKLDPFSFWCHLLVRSTILNITLARAHGRRRTRVQPSYRFCRSLLSHLLYCFAQSQFVVQLMDPSSTRPPFVVSPNSLRHAGPHQLRWRLVVGWLVGWRPDKLARVIKRLCYAFIDSSDQGITFCW